MARWREVVAGAAGRVRTSAAPAVQAAAVAGAAWWVAATFLHAPQNFFAPFAAIAVLLGGRGGRGSRAVRVVVGGVVGVGLGEVSLAVFGPNAPALFLVAAVAMLVAAALTADSLTMIHAGIGCCLVAIMANPLGGYGRLGSAVIGGAVALLGTQLLFTPSPGRLVGPAVASVLRAAADLLDRPSDPSRTRGVVHATAALDEVRDGLRRIRRTSLRGWWQADLIDDLDRTAAAAHDLGLDVLAATRPGPRDRVRGDPAARLRALAAAPARAGRPGRVIPDADEVAQVAARIGRSGPHAPGTRDR